MPALDRDLIDPNHLRSRCPGPSQLFSHVLLLQFLDRVPVQPQFPGHGLKRGSPAAPAQIPGKAVGIQGSVGQPRQLLLFHLATALAEHPPALHLQVDPRVSTGQVPDPVHLVIVERPVNAPTGAADGFFPRRWSRRIRPLGSPKTPRTVALGRKPGKRYVSSSRRSFRIRESCQIFSRVKSYRSLAQSHFRALSDAILPTQIREDPFLFVRPCTLHARLFSTSTSSVQSTPECSHITVPTRTDSNCRVSRFTCQPSRAGTTPVGVFQLIIPKISCFSSVV